MVAPGQVGLDLRCREVPGLALAGQVLGTSGYEEAAALGFLAGVNAVLAGRGERAVRSRPAKRRISVCWSTIW